jgi:hypothetical protein
MKKGHKEEGAFGSRFLKAGCRTTKKQCLNFHYAVLERFLIVFATSSSRTSEPQDPCYLNSPLHDELAMINEDCRSRRFTIVNNARRSVQFLLKTSLLLS